MSRRAPHGEARHLHGTQALAEIGQDIITASHLGPKIREARLARGLTQEQLAGDEYTKAFVSAVERDESGISDQALEVFARRLAMPVEHFRVSQRSFELTVSEVEHLLLASQPEEALAKLSALAQTGTLQGAQLPVLGRWIGHAHLEANRIEDALATLLAVLPDLEAAGDQVALQHTRLLIGIAHYRHGNIAEAIQTHQLCLKAVKDGVMTDPTFALRVYSSLGNEHVALGNYDLALAHYRDATRIAEDAQDAERMAATHWGMSVAYKERGDLEAALRHARQALALYEVLGSRRLVGQIQNNIGIVHAQMGHWGRARACYEQTLTIAEMTGDTTARAQAELNLVEYFTATGDTEQALARLPEALRDAAETGQPFYQANGLLRASATYLAAGLLDEAASYALQAMDVTEQHGLGIKHADACFHYAGVLTAQGHHAEAVPYYTRAFTTARGTPYPIATLT